MHCLQPSSEYQNQVKNFQHGIQLLKPPLQKLAMEFEQCQAFHTTMKIRPYRLKNYINLSEWKLQDTSYSEYFLTVAAHQRHLNSLIKPQRKKRTLSDSHPLITSSPGWAHMWPISSSESTLASKGKCITVQPQKVEQILFQISTGYLNI